MSLGLLRNSLSPHELRRKHVAFWSFPVHDLVVHLPSLLHDKIEHILGVVHPGIRLWQELVNRFGK